MRAGRPTPRPERRPPARRRRRRTASPTARRTHRWELRNGGGGGGEPGGRVRHSQSPPPASFEPAPKTAESGVRGRAGADSEAHRGPREHAQDLSQSERAGGRWRRRAGTQGPRSGKSSPTSPVQTKQGRERARARVPEEASRRGAGG